MGGVREMCLVIVTAQPLAAMNIARAQSRNKRSLVRTVANFLF